MFRLDVRPGGGSRRLTLSARLGGGWLILICVASVFSSLSPHPVDAVSLSESFQPPSPAHPLGTDEVGRDLLTRLLYGGRLSLVVGGTAAAVAATIAVWSGLLGASRRRLVAGTVQRVSEGVNAFPALFALIVVYGLFGSWYSAGAGAAGAVVFGALIGVFSWPTMTPIIALRVLDFYGSPRMTSQATIGAGRSHVFRYHLAPLTVAAIWPLLPTAVGSALITEGTLSFLGFGFQPPVASWGTMMASGETYLVQSPLLIVAPGFALSVTVASLLAVGEAARRVMA